MALGTGHLVLEAYWRLKVLADYPMLRRQRAVR